MTDDPSDPLRVLLVDDVAMYRELIQAVLQDDEGYQVVGHAANGKEAISQAKALEPDLVLLDLSMPVMDGMEALPEIVRVVPEARVVILSGFEAGRLGERTRSLGALGYIEKGLPPLEFLTHLGELLTGATAPA